MNKLFFLAVLIFSCSIQVSVFAQDTDIDPEGTSSCLDIKNNLRYRSVDSLTNGEVSVLQDFLQENKYLNTNPSGFFGLATVRAVKSFQSANQISPTGYVGPSTRLKIKNISCNNISTPSTDQTSGSNNKDYLREYVAGPFVQLITQKSDETWELGKVYEIRWNHIYNIKGNLHAILVDTAFNSQGKLYCDLGYFDVAAGVARVDLTKVGCKVQNALVFNTVPAGRYNIELYDEQIVPTIKGGYGRTVSSGIISVSAPATTVVAIDQSPYINTNLEIGMTGSEVLKLQRFLALKGWLNIAPTGSFDFETKKAVIGYQLANNIQPGDGYVGPITRALINSQIVPGSTTNPTSTATPTVPVSTNITSQDDSFRAYTISVEAVGGNVQLARVNMQTTLTNLKGEVLNPAEVIKSFVVRDGNVVLATIPVNTSSFTKYEGVYYIQLASLGFSVPKNSRKNLNIDVFAAKLTDTSYNIKFQVYGPTGLRFIDDAGISSFYGVSEISSGTLSPTSTYVIPATARISVPSSVVSPPVVTQISEPTILNPSNFADCPQSVLVGAVTYTLDQCTLDLVMTDGEGNKDFTIKIVSSDTNKTFGFSVYGYGEGLPTYGSLGTSSGGARGTATINRYLNDSYLNSDGTTPKVYTGYFKINIHEGGDYGKYFLYQNFKITVNPKIQ